MTPFAELITRLLSAGTVVADAAIAGLLLAYLMRRESWGRDIVEFVHRHALWIGLVLSAAAAAGSLIYSNLIGFPPCDLCWVQRIFMYPQIVIFALAIYKRDREALDYSLWLSLIGSVVAVYNVYLQFGGISVLPCAANGPSCADRYFVEYGYVTIPTMSLTIFILLALVAKIGKLRTL